MYINDRDSDQDGADDGWDQAVFDKRGQRDLDSDFISDDPDVDMDGDNLLNWWERYYGTERDNPDSDGDGVIDSYDYNGFDSRIQAK